MYTGNLSILRTNNFRCVFRYYYSVNSNTVPDLVGQGDKNISDNIIYLDIFLDNNLTFDIVIRCSSL